MYSLVVLFAFLMDLDVVMCLCRFMKRQAENISKKILKKINCCVGIHHDISLERYLAFSFNCTQDDHLVVRG